MARTAFCGVSSVRASGFPAAQENADHFKNVFVAHVPGLEADEGIDHLRHGSRPEGADEGADPDRAAEQPAAEECQSPQKDLDDPDGDIRHPLPQPDEEGIPGTAALSGFHVDHHPEGHEDESGEHQDDPEPQVFVQREGIEIVEELDEIAGQNIQKKKIMP